MDMLCSGIRRPGLRARARRYLLYALCMSAALATTATLADPGDFAAMPGLWKISRRAMHQGQAGQATVSWRCVDEGADPWAEFADRTVVPQSQCKRGDEHRRSTSLDWSLSCPGSPAATGQGRVDFDSAERFTASVSMIGHGEVVRVEGQRYAACTSARD